MPALTNAKHERFAAEIAQGKSASEAYVLAGYKAHDGNASTLRGNQKVSDRIAELMERAAVNTITTVETLLEAAWGIMKEARAKDDFSAASATLRVIGPQWLKRSKLAGGPSGFLPCGGLKPTTPQAWAGEQIEPSVSVPTAIAARLAAMMTRWSSAPAGRSPGTSLLAPGRLTASPSR